MVIFGEMLRACEFAECLSRSLVVGESVAAAATGAEHKRINMEMEINTSNRRRRRRSAGAGGHLLHARSAAANELRATYGRNRANDSSATAACCRLSTAAAGWPGGGDCGGDGGDTRAHYVVASLLAATREVYPSKTTSWRAALSRRSCFTECLLCLSARRSSNGAAKVESAGRRAI